MREQVDIIVQFAEMLKPLRIVFIEYVSRIQYTMILLTFILKIQSKLNSNCLLINRSKADSRSLTLNQYLNYQRKLLHGRETQLFKYIPKVQYTL